eukprot:355261_1
MAFVKDTEQISAKNVGHLVPNWQKVVQCQMCRKMWLAICLVKCGLKSNDSELHRFVHYLLVANGDRMGVWQNTAINYDIDYDIFTKENIKKLIYFIQNSISTSQWQYVNTNQVFSDGSFNIFIKFTYENQRIVYSKHQNLFYGRDLKIGSTYMFYNNTFVNNGYLKKRFYHYENVDNHNICAVCQNFRRKLFEKQKVKAYNKYIQDERYIFEQKQAETNFIAFDVLHNKDKNWQKDSTTDVCSICKTEFTLFRRKHHCRACGIVICRKCSVFTPKSGDYVVKDTATFEIAVVRLCKMCKDESIAYCIGANDNEKINWEFKTK